MLHRRDFLQRTAAAAAASAVSGTVARRLAAQERKPPREAATGPLRVHPDNPRYFADSSGRAVYLTGSHVWNNLVDIGLKSPPPIEPRISSDPRAPNGSPATSGKGPELPCTTFATINEFDFDAYLDFLVRHDHNFFRLWTWELVAWNTAANRHASHAVSNVVAPHPFARTGPGEAIDGKPKFDLDRFNEDYFRRLRRRVEAAGQRGIYASVMLFEGWGTQFMPQAWQHHPFHPDNNVNLIDGDVNRDGRGLEVHTLDVPAITRIQQSYIRKVIDTVGDLDNVLYEVSNETHPTSTQWQYHVIDYVHKVEQGRSKKHPVGMTFQYKGGTNQALLESPAEWISPKHTGGYRDNPPAADGKKVVLADTDHLWGIGGNRAWVWKSFIRGHNPIFMDPYDGTILGKRFDPQYEPVRQSMGHTLELARRLDLASMLPEAALASTKYCLARTTQGSAEYVVYLPHGRNLSVDLSAARGKLSVQWLDTTTGTWTAGEPVAGGGRRELKSPVKGEAVLWLKEGS